MDSISLSTIVFWVFGLINLAAGLVLLRTQRIIYAAFWLFAMLLAIAAMYVFAGAEFLAVSQLVVYVGGVLVIIIFGVMLTQRSMDIRAVSDTVRPAATTMIVVSLGAGLGYIWWWFVQHPPAWMGEAVAPTFENAEGIGIELLTHYVIPFEIVSILLLLGLIGAAYIARARSTEN